VKRYRFLTSWRFDVPVEPVWDALMQPENWPRWWPYVLAVRALESGDAGGIGAVHRFTWSSRLPYRLTFDSKITRLEPHARIEASASGDLVGTGRWDLSFEGHETAVRYEWIVSTAKPWMNLLAPFLAPAFRWNHDHVMAAGGRGLARHLGARLVEFSG
jgi:uncharacterized protein YndB with AHSA1/START domain